MTITYDQWEGLVGKTLEVRVGSEIYHGTLIGLGSSVMAVSQTEVARPWKLRTASTDLEFHPESPSVAVVIKD